MNQQMMEEAGTTKIKSSGSRRGKRHLFLWMLCQPVFLVVYTVCCRYAYKLCMYGGVKRRGSILFICGLFFLLYLLLYGYRCLRLKILTQEPEPERIWFYGFSKKGLYLFDRKHGYYEKELSGEESDFARLQYKKLPGYRYFFWKVPACIFMIAVTVLTGFGIYQSSQHFQGKLSYILHELTTTKYIALEHDNLYDSDIQGIFEDIEKDVELPEHLMLNDVFNLHFSKDGTIVRFDMMLKGYDENYHFVDSWLVSYPSSLENKIRVQNGNAVSSSEYDEEKSIDALLAGGRLLDYEELVRDWEEKEYGVYYMGSRTWNQWDENVYLLSVDGRISSVNWENQEEITGYSISIFCPDNPQITPKRFMVGYRFNKE